MWEDVEAAGVAAQESRIQADRKEHVIPLSSPHQSQLRTNISAPGAELGWGLDDFLSSGLCAGAGRPIGSDGRTKT